MRSANPRSRRARRHLGKDKAASTSRAVRDRDVQDLQSLFSPPTLSSDLAGGQATKGIVPSPSVPSRIEGSGLNAGRRACESPALDGWRFTQYSQMLSFGPSTKSTVVQDESSIPQSGDRGKYWDNSPMPGELSRDQCFHSSSTQLEYFNRDSGLGEEYGDNSSHCPEEPGPQSQLDSVCSVRTATPSPAFGYPLERTYSGTSCVTAVIGGQEMIDRETLQTSDTDRPLPSRMLPTAGMSETAWRNNRRHTQDSSTTLIDSEEMLSSGRVGSRHQLVSSSVSNYSLDSRSAEGFRPNKQNFSSLPWPGTIPQPTPPDSVASAGFDGFFAGCKEYIQDCESRPPPYLNHHLLSNLPLDFLTTPEYVKNDHSVSDQFVDPRKTQHQTLPRHTIKVKNKKDLEALTALTKFQSLMEGLKGLSDFVSAKKQELDLARMESMKRTVIRIQELRLDQEREKRHETLMEMEAYRQRTAHVEWARWEEPEQAATVHSQKTDNQLERFPSMPSVRETWCAACELGKTCAECDLEKSVEKATLKYEDWAVRKQMASATAWTQM